MEQQLKATARGRQPASTPIDPAEWGRVGATLRALRETRGFGSGEFAELLGISRSHLVSIEMGNKKLTNVNLARAAEVLGVPQKAIMRPDQAVIAEAGRVS